MDNYSRHDASQDTKLRQPESSKWKYDYMWSSMGEYVLIGLCYCVTPDAMGYFTQTEDEPATFQEIAAMFFICLPMLYMQISLGKYTQNSIINLQYMIPIMKGLGYMFLRKIEASEAIFAMVILFHAKVYATLLIIENFDISKFGKLINLMKNLSGGYKGKKSKILEADDIIKFLTQAPDDVYLFMKVITIFGVHGATRSDESHKLKVSDVDDRKSVIVVSLFDTKTKQDKLKVSDVDDRKSVIVVSLFDTKTKQDRSFCKIGDSRFVFTVPTSFLLILKPSKIGHFVLLTRNVE
ncbi:hypothetical protein QE152_g29025 [Popillia japonica]|uniref:Uncharacterized protein n=1 Tax=Popillia japonica TaxID=7064 RepID=A0AAW1JJ33_POPJA